MKKYFTVYYVDKRTDEVVKTDIVTARTASDAALIAELPMNEDDLKHYMQVLPLFTLTNK
jgi:hypothetical protein